MLFDIAQTYGAPTTGLEGSKVIHLTSFVNDKANDSFTSELTS